MKGAADRAELRSKLETLFGSIAPTVQLYRTGIEPPPPADVLAPSDTAGLNLMTWQHRGVGVSRDNVPRKYRRSVADSLRTYRSIRLNRPPGRDPLFRTRPAPGETVTKPLGRGLSVQLPLALYSRDGQTLRPDDAPSPTALRDTLSHVQGSLFDTNAAQRFADVTIGWNVFQHFYPYFPVFEVDWDGVLTSTFRRALDDDTRSAFLRTLRRMVAQLQDGHGRVQAPGPPPAGLPVKFDRVEGNVVVVDTAAYVDRALCAEIGDVVTSIDGRSPEQELRDAKQYISGSPQWKEVRALRQFGRGEPGSTVSLTVQRGKKRRRVSCAGRPARRSVGVTENSEKRIARPRSIPFVVGPATWISPERGGQKSTIELVTSSVRRGSSSICVDIRVSPTETTRCCSILPPTHSSRCALQPPSSYIQIKTPEQGFGLTVGSSRRAPLRSLETLLSLPTPEPLAHLKECSPW